MHTPHGKQVHRELPVQDLRLHAATGRRQLHRRRHQPHPRAGRRRARASARSPAASIRPSRRRSCIARSATSSRASSSTTGCMRREEPERVVETFQRNMEIPLVHVDAARALPHAAQGRHRPGAEAPHRRRDVHPRVRARGRQDRPGRLHRAGHDVPGRDRERDRAAATAAKIKTHHNVGGLPKEMTFELVEPLRYLFKDEVRQVGLRARPAGGDGVPAAVPGAGAGDPHHRRGDGASA